MAVNHNAFQATILQGIPASLPPKHQFPAGVNRAPTDRLCAAAEGRPQQAGAEARQAAL